MYLAILPHFSDSSPYPSETGRTPHRSGGGTSTASGKLIAIKITYYFSLNICKNPTIYIPLFNAHLQSA